jgi:hypothetical protein
MDRLCRITAFRGRRSYLSVAITDYAERRQRGKRNFPNGVS